MDSNPEVKHLVLYDGECGFCNQSVHFILKNERNKHLYFASLQSALGQKQLQANQLPLDYTESIVYIFNNDIYLKSKAALKLASYLKWPWSMLVAFQIFPSVVSDFFYDLVAKHRYIISGNIQSCELPSIADKNRFLD